LPIVSEGEMVDGIREAVWFLADLSKRTGSNPGPKGGLSLWGMVGNYTDAEAFVNVLRPFWADLLAVEGAEPFDYERIVVFEEREQSERASAYEIRLAGKKNGSVSVKKIDDLGFAWMQH